MGVAFCSGPTNQLPCIPLSYRHDWSSVPSFPVDLSALSEEDGWNRDDEEFSSSNCRFRTSAQPHIDVGEDWPLFIYHVHFFRHSRLDLGTHEGIPEVER